MNYKLKDMILIGLFTAMVSILSVVSIPTPFGVPLTLQTFIITACGYILGTKKGIVSIILYILLGISGVPVFAGLSGGISHLFGLSGGFIYGFIFLVFFAGYSNNFKNKFIGIALGILGLALCHILGIVQYSILSKNNLLSSFLMVSFPFLIKDTLSVVMAKVFAIYLNKILALNNSYNEV